MHQPIGGRAYAASRRRPLPLLRLLLLRLLLLLVLRCQPVPKPLGMLLRCGRQRLGLHVPRVAQLQRGRQQRGHRLVSTRDAAHWPERVLAAGANTLRA